MKICLQLLLKMNSCKASRLLVTEVDCASHSDCKQSMAFLSFLHDHTHAADMFICINYFKIFTYLDHETTSDDFAVF